MPPKKSTVEKAKKKIVEDKTFGMKNKNKSKKVQTYIKQVESAVKFSGKNHKEIKLEEKAKEDRKKAKEAQAMLGT